MNITAITILMFVSVMLLAFAGVPVAFALGGVGVVFSLWLWGPASLDLVFFNVMTVMQYFALIAIPLFLFMGIILQSSGIADDLFATIQLWAGRIKGALGMGTIVICTLMAAMVGVSGPATLSMGIIAVPAMLKRGYDKKIAVGLVQAGAALGFLIPPSIMMILYSLLAGVPVGKLFAGGVLPGLMLATLYIIYIGVRCQLQPEMGPGLPPEERGTWKQKMISTRGLIMPMFLITIVLGFIFMGITTPTEAAAIGAIGSLLCATFKRRVNWALLKETALYTARISAMCFWILIGALIFSRVYNGLGASDLIETMITGLGIGRWGILIIMQISFFLFGMFLDDIGILFICMPIYLPIIRTLGFDPIWFAILYIVNMQMAYITPPYGINLFYMRSVAPPGITMGDIYRSVIPFVALQMLGLIIIMVFPQIVLFLPNLLFGG